MPLQNVHFIEADIKEKKIMEEPRVVSNDDIAFIVSITDNGNSIDTSLVTQTVLASVRPDRKTVITPGVLLEDGTVKFELGHTETQKFGQVKATAQLFDSEGDRVSSVAFSYHVERDPTGEDYIPTEKDKTFIEVVLVDGPSVIQEAKDVTISARESGANAEQAAIGANLAADNADEARVSLQTEIDEYFDQLQVGADTQTAVYGVYHNGGSNPVMERIKGSKGKVAAVGTGGTLVQNDFDNAQIFGEIGEVTDALGNVFVRVPKHYFRHRQGRNADGTLWQIDEVSKVQHAGFLRYPLFYDYENGMELDYVDIGKHLAGYDGSNRMTSKSGVYPKVSQNIVQYRTAAQANNADGRKGYQLIDIHAIDMLRRLFLIEFATLHSQSVMAGFTNGNYSESHVAALTEAGANRVVLPNDQADSFRVGQSIGIGTSRGGNQLTDYRTITSINVVDAVTKALVFDGTPLDIVAGHFVYNTATKTGATKNLAASSGSAASNTDGKEPMSYRGVESLYGDIYQFVDGVNINDHQAWSCDDARFYQSNLFAAPYKQIGYKNHVGGGYVKEMGYDPQNPTARFPSVVGAGSTTWYSDYYYENSAQRVALFGGSWTLGAAAGLFYWFLYYSSSSAHLSYGSRLLKKAL